MFLENQLGCDSLIITNTILLSTDTTYLEFASCNPLDTGLIINTLESQNGNDSVVIEITTLLPSDSTYLNLSSCNEQDTGFFIEILENQFGCDSTIFTQIEFALSDSVFINQLTCFEEEIGIEILEATNQFGCDSITTITTTLEQTDTLYLQSFSCNPLDTGIFQSTLPNPDACPIIQIETISLAEDDFLLIENLSCNPNDTATVTLNLTNQFGCDSTIVIQTALLPSDTIYQEANSNNPNDVGLDTLAFQNQFGCDSLIITNTIFIANDTTLLEQYTCNIADTGTVITVLENTQGNDSIVIEQSILLPADSTFLEFQTCISQDTGLVLEQYENQLGCDSLVFIQTNLIENNLNFEINRSDLTCFESNDGSIQILTNETLSIEWSDNNNDFERNNLSAGLYSFTINDGNCSSTETIEILEPLPLNLELIGLTDCVENGGAIVASVLGGTAPYAYNWSNGANTSDIENLIDGTYTLTITDSNDCIEMTTIVLETIAGISNLEVERTNISCWGETDGQLSVVPIGGTAPYTYNWSNGATTSTIENLATGNYQLFVTDSNDCDIFGTFSINEPALLEAEIVTVNPSSVSNDGVLEAIVQGGTPPYTYAWSTGEQSPIIEDLSLGNYIVTITDANDCMTIDEHLLATTSTNQLYADIEFKVFPNPNRGQFQIQIDLPSITKGQLRLIDIHGKVVELYSTQGKNIHYQLDEPIDAGAYIVQWIGEDYTISQKVIVLE